MTITFADPTGQGQFARIAFYGKSFTGKTYSALAVAAALVPGGKVAVVDTENRVDQYRDRFSFQRHRPASYAVSQYIAAIEAADQRDYDVIILDSLTDAWVGQGGALTKQRSSSKKDGRASWAKPSEEQHALYEVIRNSGLHVIATMRVLEEGNKDLRPIQRQDIAYVFGTMGYLDERHTLHITKAMCPSLQDRSFTKPGSAQGCQFVAILRDWLCLDDTLTAKKTAFRDRIIEKYGERVGITDGAGVKWLLDQAGVAYHPDNEARVEKAIQRAVQDIAAQRQRNGDAPQQQGLMDVEEAPQKVAYP